MRFMTRINQIKSGRWQSLHSTLWEWVIHSHSHSQKGSWNTQRSVWMSKCETKINWCINHNHKRAWRSWSVLFPLMWKVWGPSSTGSSFLDSTDALLHCQVFKHLVQTLNVYFLSCSCIIEKVSGVFCRCIANCGHLQIVGCDKKKAFWGDKLEDWQTCLFVNGAWVCLLLLGLLVRKTSAECLKYGHVLLFIMFWEAMTGPRAW